MEDWRLTLLALAAENMFRNSGELTPTADPMLEEFGLQLRGYLLGVDALFRKRDRMALFDSKVFYGFLAEEKAAPGTFYAVVRGTEGFLEWVIDAEFALMNHPVGGRVEAGFWGVYETMKFLPAGGVEEDLVPGLVAVIGLGRVTVVGHSLGAALATYLAFDLSAPLGPSRCAAQLVASPRPGDAQFSALFTQRVKNCEAVAYEFDLVPRVPMAFGYSPLAAFLKMLRGGNAAARIRVTPLCNHHALCYAVMQNFQALDVAAHLGEDFRDCVLGPAQAAAVLGSMRKSDSEPPPGE